MEGIQEGTQKGFSADFHPKEVIDPVEKLLEKLGPEGTFDELVDKLDRNPNDTEARRQANLLINRLDDLISRLKEKKVQH